MDTSILHQSTIQKQQPDLPKILNFLTEKITEYTAIVEKQRTDLKHNEILLKGFITWKTEIERKEAQR